MFAPNKRVIMISGANRGIGYAIADKLYDVGYTLSLGTRYPEKLVKETEAWDSDRLLIGHYDAEKKKTHSNWVDETVNRFGRLDGLVNNAGIMEGVSVEDENDEALDRMWAVNVKAPLSMIRNALPYLRRSEAGRIINVASLAGKAVYGTGIGYSMTKFAAVALSHATRHAGWDDGVRCTALCPGYVATDMTKSVETMALDQMTEPRDLAEIVATLLGLSNKASIAELIINCRNDVMM